MWKNEEIYENLNNSIYYALSRGGDPTKKMKNGNHFQSFFIQFKIEGKNFLIFENKHKDLRSRMTLSLMFVFIDKPIDYFFTEKGSRVKRKFLQKPEKLLKN